MTSRICRLGATAALLACLCSGATNAQGTPPAQVDLAVKARRLLDPSTGQYAGPVVILVNGSRIIDVVSADRFVPGGAKRVVDFGEATVLPGLIDAHVHLTIGGTVRANAAANLQAGFTTVADLGARGTRFLQLRDSINNGLIEGPRVIAAGMWIGVKDGVCEFAGIGIAGGADQFRKRVRDNVDAGANLIKLCISGWPAAAFVRPDAYEMPDSTIAAAVDEAHRLGRKVVAHDISIGGVRAALRAGVDGLAHAAYVDDEVARLLAERRVFMISTLTSLGDASLLRSVHTAHRAGVMVVFGTDGGVLPHGRNAEEFTALSRAGLSPLEAIRAATVNAARALQISDSVGYVGRGMIADIIAVDGDPLTDLSSLARVRAVIAKGRLVDKKPGARPNTRQ